MYVILGSVLALLLFFLTFLPYVFGKTAGQRETASYVYSLLVTLGCILLLGLCGFLALLFFKRPLKHALFHFKKVIDALVAYVKNMAGVYTRYLTKLADFMQMNSFRRYVDSNVDDYLRSDENKLVINRNYCIKIEELCRLWSDSFGFELKYDTSYEESLVDYDYEPERNSIFSFDRNGDEYKFKYNNKESELFVPCPFVSSLNIFSEEVYE